MKQPPDTQKLEQVLRSAAFSATGFMGNDCRILSEIIDSDVAELNRLGHTPRQIAERMREITEAATQALGNWVNIGDNLRAMITEAKGRIPCPWPHAGNFAKRVTTLEDSRTGKQIYWSDLNIHLIQEHSFFEGKGSPFRIEPKQITEMLF